ncbi:DNA sulfur modification protein DndB [Prevotella melaninogenica]|uniref:DNA sulfur modification protein DndB n=1 Tax=Prevotella melaninogenica TaxID=28132 RepID=UPI001C5D305A|nr:DNA sulfur modification protein DndB [Prevotella melaninogenica]MBW4901220.1 DGQHR domain-containing protein [Prevotella melaninogenica]
MESAKIPAIKGKIGNTIYYCTTMSFRQISSMVKKVDEELHTANSLKEQIQRSLTNNYIKIKNYILNREDRFFDSLVLAVYDGDPLWTEVRFEIENRQYPNIGLLEFSGHEKIFPVDGQHRVEGIRAALEQNEELKNETISVMLIGHQNTTEGREKSRRIFSTLNRYVKPVRLGDIIALDEDDIVAIVTRDLLETYPLFMGERIKASNNKSIPQTDKKAFTSLITLYECHLSLYKSFISKKDQHHYGKSQIKDMLKSRPSDDIIAEFNQYLVDFWDCMNSTFEEIEVYINNNSDNPAAELRSTENGGNLFFRPIGLFPFVEAIARILLATNKSFDEIISGYVNLKRNVHSDMWDMILWNPINRRMIMRNQSLVYYLLIKIMDDSILTERENTNMISKYATIFNIELSEARRRIATIRL